MRLVTRSDFDGLACAVLLNSLGLIDEYKFAHPKDLQDGLIQVTENDILTNVPYVAGCGMWFDHHTSESERVGHVSTPGLSKAAPSCARVIWEYYKGHEAFPTFLDTMLEYVDRIDSGNITLEEIRNPTGWILLGFLMDPRTGLGRYRDYRISNYQLMLDMIRYCAEMSAEEILRTADVQERVTRYFKQEEDYKHMIRMCSSIHNNVLVLDLRNQEEIYSGNRFSIYAMYPECNISMHVMWGLKQQNTVFTIGHSILNRSSKVDVGSLLLRYGGGGHMRVGTCQVPTEDAPVVLASLIDALQDT